eukprot:6490898-Amphidinium_carterae.2
MLFVLLGNVTKAEPDTSQQLAVLHAAPDLHDFTFPPSRALLEPPLATSLRTPTCLHCQPVLHAQGINYA